MPSYMDLQAEAQRQAEAWEEYEKDLRLRAEELWVGFRGYLSVPYEKIQNADGTEFQYVDFGIRDGRTFTPSNRFQLPVGENTVSFTIAVNIVHDKGCHTYFYDIRMSKARGHYDINVAEPAMHFRQNGVSASPDFTEVYEALSRNLLERLQQRP